MKAIAYNRELSWQTVKRIQRKKTSRLWQWM